MSKKKQSLNANIRVNEFSTPSPTRTSLTVGSTRTLILRIASDAPYGRRLTWALGISLQTNNECWRSFKSRQTRHLLRHHMPRPSEPPDFQQSANRLTMRALIRENDQACRGFGSLRQAKHQKPKLRRHRANSTSPDLSSFQGRDA